MADYTYTLFLKNGIAYQNNAEGAIVSSDALSAMGLTYITGSLTMNNFNFSTSSGKGVVINDNIVTITVNGSNSISTSNANGDTCGIYAEDTSNTPIITINGSGILDITVADSAKSDGYSRGIYAKNSTNGKTDIIITGTTLNIEVGAPSNCPGNGAALLFILLQRKKTTG